MEDITGKQFGAYEIVAPLGEGGMASVYKAYQPAMERYVALKVIPRHFASDVQFGARFKREAKLLAQLQHPHILPVFDYGQVEGYSYIVMPFIRSGTLTDLLKGVPLPFSDIRQFISQVGDALSYAHARGLIHRDVKPSNVLIDESGNCLLADFGLARMVEGSDNLTASGAVMGTPAYMSPEQGSGSKIDARSDVYSLGIVLYEMATGRVPYQAETPIAVVFKHIQDPLPPARMLNPELPESIELVILKALSKNPEYRYQTVADMVRALQAAIPNNLTAEASKGPDQAPQTESISPKISESELAPTQVAKSERRLPINIWGLIGAVILILLIGGGFFVYRMGAIPATVATVSSTAKVAVPSALPTMPILSDAIIATGELRLGQELRSVDKQCSLKLERDGNLVVYDNVTGDTLWSSNTKGSNADHLIMQDDGNLVLFTKDGAVVWSSETSSVAGNYYLQMQNGGNLVVYRGKLYSGKFEYIWDTGTSLKH